MSTTKTIGRPATKPASKQGQKIRRARRAAQLTVAQAAKRAGVTPSSWYDWEAGRFEPRMATLKKIAKAIKVGLIELV